MEHIKQLLSEKREVEITPRQREVLSYLVQGKKNKQIAEALNLSEATIKLHLARIYKKFGVKNRVEMFIVALHLNLY